MNTQKRNDNLYFRINKMLKNNFEMLLRVMVIQSQPH